MIREERLGDAIALVGCFCMERCGECMNWKFDDEEISSTSVEEAEAALRSKLREAARDG
jgi:hypothetical protein